TPQADGKILIGGQFTSVGATPRTNLARLNADGSVDGTFNSASDGPVYSLAVQADGLILVGGVFNRLAGQPRSNIGRLKADGALDLSFDPGADDAVNALVVQPDGNILVGGEFHTLGGESHDYFSRLYPDGSPDFEFQLYLQQLTRAVHVIALQSDGNILLGGEYGYGRLTTDGSVDGTFYLDPQNFLSLYNVY